MISSFSTIFQGRMRDRIQILDGISKTISGRFNLPLEGYDDVQAVEDKLLCYLEKTLIDNLQSALPADTLIILT